MEVTIENLNIYDDYDNHNNDKRENEKSTQYSYIITPYVPEGMGMLPLLISLIKMMLRNDNYKKYLFVGFLSINKILYSSFMLPN